MLPLLKFARTLAGQYSNYQQAQSNPKDFARIEIFFRPLPFKILGKPAFYSEQFYEYDPWNPYRQGLHNLEQKGDIFIVDNFGYEQQDRIAGAGKHPQLLHKINTNKIVIRCGCAMHFKEVNDGSYIGFVEPGKKCIVPRDGKITYLVSEVELDSMTWNSRDRGYDITTDTQCWGSEHGLLRFERIKQLNECINENWIKTEQSKLQ